MPTINDELIARLYGGANPYMSAQPRFMDSNYPHTNIRIALIDYLLLTYRPSFWLEIGSFVGGSALKVAEAVKKHGTDTGIVCCDPFCGDVNMWDWELNPRIVGKNGVPYRFLNFEHGLPSIYQRFLANIVFSGYSDIVTPIQVTSIVGIRLLDRLLRQGRISQKPTVIYLDSAHEVDETYLELSIAWNYLPEGGLLVGDDWGWGAIRNDVTKFAAGLDLDVERANQAHEHFASSQLMSNVFLFEGQWVLFKRCSVTPA